MLIDPRQGVLSVGLSYLNRLKPTAMFGEPTVGGDTDATGKQCSTIRLQYAPRSFGDFTFHTNLTFSSVEIRRISYRC